MKSCKVLAFDFGASTGRAVLGSLSRNTLRWEEVYRFDNVPVRRGDTLYWDIDAFMAGIREGMERAGSFDSVAFDTWGVDFGLLDSEDNLLEAPVHYRDGRTVGMAEAITEKISPDGLYRLTGNQIMEISTLFQLTALKRQSPDMLGKARKLLFMPDLFAFLISGKAVCEQSIASTSQMLNPSSRQWCTQLLEKLGLPADILLPVIPSGSVTGILPNGSKVIAAAGQVNPKIERG